MNQRLKCGIVTVMIGWVIAFLYGCLIYVWFRVMQVIPCWRTNFWMPYVGSPLLTDFSRIVILVLVYNLIYKLISGKGFRKGLVYGFIIWLVTSFPRLLYSYIGMAAASKFPLYCSTAELFNALLLGVIIGLSFRKILQ